MAAEALGPRALNRATLARQMLLGRSGVAPVDAVTHLVGLQAQEPPDPYVALWSRLRGFRPAALEDLLTRREVVRIVLMRGTIHLVAADDAVALRPLVQPILDAELARHGDHAEALRDLDLTPVLAVARPFLEERPRTNPELRAELGRRFPGHSAAALAYACRNHLALVQVPPRGLWERSARVTTTTLEAWLGRPAGGGASIDDVVLRYLGAFGPASAADVAAWSRLTGFREVLERLRPGLRAFRDERGREVFDLPEAPRPDPDTPAPPRFLPAYDNLLLSHADRGRFAAPEALGRAGSTGGRRGTFLVDGVVAGTWAAERGEGRATLAARHLGRLAARDRRALAAEGRRLLAMLAPDAAPEVTIAPLGTPPTTTGAGRTGEPRI